VPLSGNAALAAGALIQLALGIEFILGGLDKMLDPNFAAQLEEFIATSPATRSSILSPLLQGLVLPHPTFAARFETFTELGAGLVLALSAVEVARRRLPGPLGSQHRYEAAVALMGAGAAIVAAGLSATFYLLLGGGVPSISGANAVGSPIAIELLLVPLALGIAWLEIGRFRALRTHAP
jgi:hypothetical protein